MQDLTPPAWFPGSISAMEGFWAVFWIAVVLKIPLAMLLYIVWWAVKDPPVAEAEDTGGGGSDRDPRPHPRGPLSPRPRRGPHADPYPSSPPRVRTARGRRRVPAGHS
jgi:hypothetical protein